jgi:hypothetical protein
MRLFAPLTLTLGLLAGQAHAAVSVGERGFEKAKLLYCKGDNGKFFVFSVTVNIDDADDIDTLQRIGGVTCARFSVEEMRPLRKPDEPRTGLRRMGTRYVVFYDEYEGPNKETWYRWGYGE